MNLKAKCAVCKGNLVKGEQTTKLMIGPQGYRSYALCLRCAGKTPLSSGTKTSPHLEVHKMGGGMKAGAR